MSSSPVSAILIVYTVLGFHIQVGLYDNHDVVKQNDFPVQTLGDIGGDAADGLSAELSLADDLHAFSFATEDADQVGKQLCSAHPMPLCPFCISCMLRCGPWPTLRCIRQDPV